MKASLLLGLVMVLVASAMPLDRADIGSYYFVRVDIASLQTSGNFSYLLSPLRPATPARADAQLSDFIGGYIGDRHQPQVILSVDENILKAMVVTFQRPHSLVMPPFTIYAINGEIEDENQDVHNEYVVDETRVWPSAADDEVTFTLNERPELSELPKIVIVMIKVDHFTVTSFIYNLPNVTEEMKEGSLWDLAPSNSSMSFKFLAKYHPETDKLGIWLSRKPPIPDYSLLVAVGGKVVAHENIAHPHPSGVGITHAVSDATKITGPITCVVHFYEKERTHKAKFLIPDYADYIRKLRDEPDAEKQRHGIALKANSGALPGLALQLKYLPNTKQVAAMVFQPFPLSHLMMSVKIGSFVLFREEESHIPEMDQNAETQFGWYQVIPATEEALEDLTTNIAGDSLEVEVQFNARAPNAHPLDLMKEWITDYGGKVRDVVLTKTRGGHGRFTLHEHGLSIDRNALSGEVIAEVPYRVILSDNVVEANTWINKVKKNSKIFDDAALELGLNPEQIRHFMLMCFFIIIQPNHHLDGTNWHLYFRTIPKEPAPLPHYYTEDELALFSFSPAVRDQVERMEKLWKAEYETLVANAAWVKNSVSYDDYRTLRGHVESRVFNISSTLVMVPLFDYLNHDDNASIVVAFDDKDQTMRFSAERDLRSGDPLTIDYGFRTKTKLDFLLQFGFIPPHARDGAIVKVGDEDVFLSESVQDSHGNVRAAVKNLLRAQLPADDDEDREKMMIPEEDVDRKTLEVLTASLASLPRHAPKLEAAHTRSKHNPPHLNRYEELAARLLKSERSVVSMHHSYASQVVAAHKKA
jgi:hypothetical protein